MLFNRHHITTLLQALLMLFAFASCIDDDFTDGATSSSDKTELYMSFQVFQTSDWSQTRAATRGDEENDEVKNGGFVHGSELEHKVGTEGNFVIFFKKDKTLHSIELIELALGHKDDPGHEPATDPTDYIEARYRTKFYATEDNMPTWCLLVLNGKQIYYELKDWEKDFAAEKPNTKPLTMDNILKHVWDESANDKDPKKIGFNDKGLFTMINSAYVEDGEVCIAAEIKDENIAHMPPEIDEKSVPLHIHVERMVAKCTLKLNIPEKDFKESGDTTLIKPEGATPLVFFEGFSEDGTIGFVSVRDWRIHLTGWGINAWETKNYLFKNINANSKYFGNNLEWNDDNCFRSYWSEDPHYDYEERNDNNTPELVYPWQYRKAIDDPTISYYSHYKEHTGTPNDNLLRNYSYYDFKFKNHEGEDNEHNVDNFNFSKPVYVPENTYDKDLVNGKLDSRDELLAGTHLLIGAELEVYDNDTHNGRYRIYDLHRDRNGIYYESERECFASLVHSFNQSLTSQSVMEFVLYDWENGGGRVLQKQVGNETITLQPTDTLVAKTNGNFMLCYKYPGKSDYTVLDEKQLAKIIGKKAEKESITASIENFKEDSIEFATTFGSMVPATLRRGDGRRLPWTKFIGDIQDNIQNKRLAIKKVKKSDDGYVVDDSNSDVNLSIHKKTKNKYGATVANDTILWDNADANDVKSMLYEWLGAVDHFNNGKMYYATGIDNTPEINTKSEKHYGVVRNSWYQFRLNQIKSIGVPVDDPTQPIVPDKVSNNDQINVAVKILPWHEIEGDVPVFFW